MSAHIAFVSSPELRHDSELLIARIEAGSQAPPTALMIRTISNFTDEILQVFFIDLIKLLPLSDFMEKVINGTVNTIKNTVHGISRAVIQKLDKRQLPPLADYMGGVMLTAPDTSGDPTPYVGFPLNDATQSHLQTLIQDMRKGEPKEYEQELVHMLIEITDRALEVYVLMPIELLRPGLILRKIAAGSVAVIRGGIHLVFRKLGTHLEGSQLLAVANHLSGLILANGKPYR